MKLGDVYHAFGPWLLRDWDYLDCYEEVLDTFDPMEIDHFRGIVWFKRELKDVADYAIVAQLGELLLEARRGLGLNIKRQHVRKFWPRRGSVSGPSRVRDADEEFYERLMEEAG